MNVFKIWKFWSFSLILIPSSYQIFISNYVYTIIRRYWLMLIESFIVISYSLLQTFLSYICVSKTKKKMKPVVYTTLSGLCLHFWGESVSADIIIIWTRPVRSHSRSRWLTISYLHRHREFHLLDKSKMVRFQPLSHSRKAVIAWTREWYL